MVLLTAQSVLAYNSECEGRGIPTLADDAYSKITLAPFYLNIYAIEN